MLVSKSQWLIGGLGLLCAGIFFFFDPADSGFFPQCPFRMVTGWLCPGCGSQRAIHDLLHLQLGEAFAENPLLVISLPYLLTAFVFKLKKEQGGKWPRARQTLFGARACWVIFAVVVAFWIWRNVV